MLKNRKIFPKIWKEIDSHHIILLNGARQVGKTTLMKMVREKLISERNISENKILWFDLEQTDDLEQWKTQRDALNILPLKNTSGKYYLFIDEFQRSPEIGSTLKVIHDHYPHIKPIITGSASWYLNIDESMAGRKIVIPIWPLDFEEFIDWENEEKTKRFISLLQDSGHLPAGLIESVNQKLVSFLTFGGYPEVNNLDNVEEKISTLKDLVNSYLTRDIKIWNYKANSLQVKKLLALLSSLVGNLLEKQKLSVNSELNRVALENRLELLQNTFILHLLHPFSTNKTKELTRNPKVYLIDCGLRNYLLDNFSILPKTTDFGSLAENFAVTELLKNISVLEQVYYWRTRQGQEVDIILKRKNQLIPIEVKGGNQVTIPSGLKSFIRNYQPKEAYVLNWSIIKDEQYQNCQIKF
ncbi:MAG TPA: ATP-binding protein, partial [Candidatus Moranbacteria bacterium]|nr:ATP-binding protein [Candidatus Moranbacteria bacterium]